MYLLRTIPENIINDFTIECDKLVLDAFQFLIESPINLSVHSQIKLNLKNGGTGLRATNPHSLASTISSYVHCKER